MVNTSSNRILRWLIIEMEPSVTNFNEYVSCTSKFSIEDNPTTKELLVELNTLFDIRSKDMYVMNVTKQLQFLLHAVDRKPKG